VQNSTVAPRAAASLEWDDIRYFLELARTGSLSATARRLDVRHSTVARRVDALEKAADVRLFDRLPRGWALTPEGEMLVDHAKRIEEEAMSFARAVHGVAALHGTVRLSVPPVFGTEAGLATRRLGTMRFGVYATRAWLKRAPDEWEFIGYDGTLADSPQQQWLVRFAKTRPFVFVTNDLTSILHACRAGAGIAAMPRFIAAGDKALVQIDTQPPCDVTRDNIWLVVHPDVKRSPRVRTVADALAEIVGEAGEVL
jgi:DNA-binding transcriptional LysR family regulator